MAIRLSHVMLAPHYPLPADDARLAGLRRRCFQYLMIVSSSSKPVAGCHESKNVAALTPYRCHPEAIVVCPSCFLTVAFIFKISALSFGCYSSTQQRDYSTLSTLSILTHQTLIQFLVTPRPSVYNSLLRLKYASPESPL